MIFMSDRQTDRQTDLSLPVSGVDQDDGIRNLIIREQDVVQLIQDRLPGNLKKHTNTHQYFCVWTRVHIIHVPVPKT